MLAKKLLTGDSNHLAYLGFLRRGTRNLFYVLSQQLQVAAGARATEANIQAPVLSV